MHTMLQNTGIKPAKVRSPIDTSLIMRSLIASLAPCAAKAQMIMLCDACIRAPVNYACLVTLIA